MTKNEENWQNQNRLMNFSEIWYADAPQSQQKKKLQKTIFGFRPFLAFLWPKKQPKLTKNEEIWQNPNRLVKNSEISYLDASQQKKMLLKFFFGFRNFFVFLLPKNSQNWPKMKKIGKIQTVWQFLFEISYVNAFQQKTI